MAGNFDRCAPAPRADSTSGTAAVPPSSDMNVTPLHSITSSARASSVGGIVEAKRLGGRQIDDEVELGRLLDRNVGRFRPAQNLVDKLGGAPEQVRKSGP